MTDKKRIKKAVEDGAFESPVGDNLKIAGTELKSSEKGYEITVGEEAIRGLKQLGVNEKADGTMAIPAHNTRIEEKESKVGKTAQEER